MSSTLEHVVRLTPPAETTYFKHISETICDNQRILNESGTYVADLTWDADIYVYVSGAAPGDPRFPQKGGVITIFVVHQGTLGLPSSGSGLSDRVDFVYKVISSARPSSVRQFPPTNSGTQSGDNWQYSIDYQESLPLFKNGGNEVFVFDAAYRDGSTLANAKQSGSSVTNGAEFDVVLQKRISPGASFPIVALSVLKFGNPTAFPITLDFQFYEWIRPRSEVYSAIYGKKVTISLDFS